jgi:hypothetical protein
MIYPFYADDMEKNSHLIDLQSLGPLEIFRAELDIDGSFDEAVAGCDYAFLVAAPMNLNPENPEVNEGRYNQNNPCLFVMTDDIADPHTLIFLCFAMAERCGGASGAGNAKRNEVMRESRQREARDPDIVDSRRLQQAAARRRACVGRRVLVRCRVPQSLRQIRCLGASFLVHALLMDGLK